jgi:hypothetical protein
MNRFDQAFQPGSKFLIVLGLLLVAFFTVIAILEPEHRYFSLVLVIIGLGGVVRNLHHSEKATGL